MTDRCFDPTELGELLRLEPGDPRREHLARCPLCRGRLAAFEAFLAERPAAGSSPAEADAALERFITRTLRRPHPAHPAHRAGPGGWLAALAHPPLRRLAGPALAAAALVTLAVLWVPSWRGQVEPSGRLRGAPSSPAPAGTPGATLRTTTAAMPAATSRLREDGAVTLQWRRVPGADEYRVQLFSPSLEEIACFTAATDTVLILAPDRLTAFPGPIFWRVQAWQDGGEVGHSPPTLLPSDAAR